MPFRTADGKDFPVPVLAQLDRKTFQVCVPFQYRRNEGDPWITVPKSRKDTTDLASVPGFLLWFVPRYGVHTLAALVHDQLVSGEDQPLKERRDADDTFRDALGELNVPFIRRWFMWAAVSLATMVSVKGLDRYRVAAWGLLVGAASLTFWQSRFAELGEWEPWSWLIFGQSWWGDLLIITAASLVLFPRFVLGIVAGAGLWFIFVPTLFVLVTLVAYVVLEWLLKHAFRGYVSMRPNAELTVNPVRITVDEAKRPERGCPELVGQRGKTAE